MSKMLKKAIHSFFLWIGKYLLEAASFFEVKEEVEVHTAQITAGEEPVPKEEDDPPPKARGERSNEPIKYGHFYALRLAGVSSEVAEGLSGLKKNTFGPSLSRRPRIVDEKFILWYETTRAEDPKNPLLNHKKVQKDYPKAIKRVEDAKAGKVQKINASLKFPKEARGKGETLKRVKPENLNLGLLSLLSRKEPAEYRRPSLSQPSAATILGMTSHHYLKNNPKEVVEEAREAAEEWVRNYPINVEKAWEKVEKISLSMAKKDPTSLREVCKKEKLNIAIFQVFWALDIVFKDEGFRDMFPTLHKKKGNTVLHKDLS